MAKKSLLERQTELAKLQRQLIAKQSDLSYRALNGERQNRIKPTVAGQENINPNNNQPSNPISREMIQDYKEEEQMMPVIRANTDEQFKYFPSGIENIDLEEFKPKNMEGSDRPATESDIFKEEEKMKTFSEFINESTPAWQRSAGKDPEGGLNRKGIASYRRENPGSKLKKAVTGKVKPGSKAAKRRKSFCARMGGMKGAMKKPNGEPTRKALALRKWKCR